jgi:hypothetical protein
MEETGVHGAGDGDDAGESKQEEPSDDDMPPPDVDDEDSDQPTKADAGAPDEPFEEGDAAPPAGAPSLILPFVVDDYFVSSGYMGDAMVDGTSVTMIPAKSGDDGTCGDDRPSVVAKGKCHQVTYHASSVANAPGWAGVFWQANVDDWGSLPGERVESGATRVVFSAKGKVGGEIVTFGVGGINSAGLPHHDSFDQQAVLTLTNQWQEYEISLVGVSYSEVLGGFRWVAAKQTSDVSFFVDDIRWE